MSDLDGTPHAPGAPDARDESRSSAGRAVRYGATPLVVLAATVMLENGERLSLAQAFDGLKEEFHLSDTALGFIPAAMILVGLVGSFPFGFLADRVRRTALLGTGMAIWTVCMLLNGFAPGYGLLFAARLGVGAVEANGPAAVSLLSDYYPVRERAKRIGLYQSGGLIGAILGLLIGGIAVSQGSWRWAFWMWVPVGAIVTIAVLRLPEPKRGDQDADFHDDLALDMGAVMETVAATDIVERIALPPPTRVGTLDYNNASVRDVWRELSRIRSMWFALLAITISSLMLNGLQVWAVEFFKRVHGLSAAQAGVFTTIFGLGAAVGVMGGGFLADNLLRRGILNARVYVVAFSSMAAAAVLLPGFLTRNLAVAGAFMTLGGLLLTLPIAPGEAMMNDVIVAQLRGRAATARSIVRSLGAAGPLLVGVLSSAFGIRTAVASIVPIYAVGGLVMLLAARTYPSDLAYMGAETRRVRAAPGG